MHTTNSIKFKGVIQMISMAERKFIKGKLKPMLMELVRNCNKYNGKYDGMTLVGMITETINAKGHRFGSFRWEIISSNENHVVIQVYWEIIRFKINIIKNNTLEVGKTCDIINYAEPQYIEILKANYRW